MTDREMKIAEIRADVEKTEEGLWVPQEDCPNCKGTGSIVSDTEAGREYDDCYCLIPDNRLYNAKATERIRFLLSELDREHEESHKDRVGLNQRIMQLEVENRKLREERDKLIKGLQSLLIELDQKWEEAHQKWKTEADMYYQGAEYAFDFAESNLRGILKEIGVDNHDTN